MTLDEIDQRIKEAAGWAQASRADRATQTFRKLKDIVNEYPKDEWLVVFNSMFPILLDCDPPSDEYIERRYPEWVARPLGL